MPHKLSLGLALAAALLVGAACTKPTPSASENTPPAEQPAATAPATNTNMAATAPKPAPTTPPPAASKTVNVDMNNGGFSPATITVSAGTKVTFINRGTKSMRPASDPHPTHTALPGFDPKRGIAPTESWSYTFTKVGTWRYHDHLSSLLTGTVIVK